MNTIMYVCIGRKRMMNAIIRHDDKRDVAYQREC